MSSVKDIQVDQSSPIKSDGHSAENSDEQDSNLETTPGKTPASEKLPPRAVKTPKNTNGKLEDHPLEDNLLEITNFMKETNKEVGKSKRKSTRPVDISTNSQPSYHELKLHSSKTRVTRRETNRKPTGKTEKLRTHRLMQ